MKKIASGLLAGPLVLVVSIWAICSYAYAGTLKIGVNEEPPNLDPHTVDLITREPYGLVLELVKFLFPMDKAFYSGIDRESGLSKDQID